MNQHCQSCAAPLNAPGMKGASDQYCKYCTDAKGKLKSRDEVQKGIAGWLKSWGGNLTDKQASERAAHYMMAMPAWAS